MGKTVSLFKHKTGSWEEFPQTCAVYGHISRLMGGLMLLEEPYSELAPKIPSLSADCLGAGMPGHGWAPQHVDQALCGEMEQQQGETERGESRLVCTPVPLLVTVGPGRPGPDPTWVISAECEVRPVVGPAITPPSLVSQVLRVQGAEPHARQHRNPLSLAPLPKGSSPTRSGLKPLGGRSC